MKDKSCSCHYAMADRGYYYICTKCFNIEYKTDIKSKLIRFLKRLRIFVLRGKL